MAYDYKVLDVKEVLMKDLVIGKGQARKTNVARDVTELADSIRTVGQLHPIVISESSTMPGKYEILTGQRRYLACQELGKEEIWATILDRPIPEEEAKVISFTENVIKTDLPKEDIIDMCTYLWKLYGSHKIIAAKTGLPPDIVRENVKYISLIPELRELVDNAKVKQETALRAQKALEVMGEVVPNVAVSLAKKLQGCIGTVQSKVVKEVASGAITTTEEIDEYIQAIKSGPTLVDLRLRLFPEQNKALTDYAQTEGMQREDAAQTLLMDSLANKGFLEEPAE
ncbi:ParB/RepB/Spo0J family partition protein [Chloroflexota bacterium]